jgi:hypothetical protein
MTVYLGQYVEHPKWKILKIQILSSCGHSVEHWQKQIKWNQDHWCCTVLARPNAVAMLLDGASIDSSPLCPDPSHGRRRRRGGSTPGPPLSSSQQPARCRPPGCIRADPQPPAAKQEPFQHASVAAVAGETFERNQDPRAGELLVALLPASWDYKYPLRSNEATHLTPSYLQDIVA